MVSTWYAQGPRQGPLLLISQQGVRHSQTLDIHATQAFKLA